VRANLLLNNKLSQHDNGGNWQFILGSVHPPEIIIKDDLGIEEPRPSASSGILRSRIINTSTK